MALVDYAFNLISALIGGGLVSIVTGYLFLRRTTLIQEDIKSQYERAMAVFQSTRGWKEESVSKLLGPIYMQLDRTGRAFNRWGEKNLYLEMKIIREGNLTIRDLLLQNANLIPPSLRKDAGELIEHYDRWLEEFENQRGGKEPDLQTKFVFVGPLGFPFPKHSEERFKSEFERLWKQLYGNEVSA